MKRRMGKKVWTTVVAACLLALWGCGGGERTLTVLQWNVWQEGTKVPGGYGAIVEEIARLKPDFVTLSEVRNYGGVDFTGRLVDSLRARGEVYYSFRSYDSGILSRHPIEDTATVFPERDDHGSIYKAVATLGGRRVAVYTAHLDWQRCCYYNTHWVEANRDMYDHGGLVVEWTVCRLLEEAGFRDAYREVWPDPLTHPGFTYPAWIEGVDPLRVTWTPRADERERIDYVFVVGEGMVVTRVAVFGPKTSIVRGERVEESLADEFVEPLGTWPSDHKGVWVELRMDE